MENNQPDNKKDKIWWRPAIIMFVRVSVWVAIPVIIALYVGKYLDKRYDTAPWMFIGTTVVAFIISMVAIARISMKYIHKIEKENKEKNDRAN